MILRDNENPYLRGKKAKKHLAEGQWMTNSPFEGMDPAQKAAAVAEFVKEHAEKFEAGMARLKKVCRSFNAFQILGHFSYYDVVVLDQNSRNPDYKPVEQSAVELLQALILHVPADELRSKIRMRPPLEIFTELNKLLGGIVSSFAYRRYDKLADAANPAAVLQEAMRSHTAAARNEGYPSQVQRTMIELVAPLDAVFEARRGLKLSSLVTMLWNLPKLIEKRLNLDFSQRRAVLFSADSKEIITNFVKHHNFDARSERNFRAELKRENYGLRDLRGYLMSIWDRNNFLFFSLTLEDCVAAYPGTAEPAQLERVFSTWSLAHGALAQEDPEHFFLDNPVWSKPFIQFGPHDYLLPVLPAIQSFGRRLLENFLQTEPDLWEKYQKVAKPEFLERFTSQLFAKAVPAATVFTNVEWSDPGTKIKYESDVLVVIDTQALIVECKSGSISAAARRGAPKRLAREIAELIEGPTLQSQRFADYLSTTSNPLEIKDAKGQKHKIDPTQLTRIARLNVTLDYFGALGVQARKLRETGLVAKELAPAATIPAHDLENIVDVLPKPTLLFHYLQRRAELESTNDLLTNESSLLALYLSTGFDLGDVEKQGLRGLAVSMDEQLEPYFMGKELNRPVPKPQRRFTPWWRDMLFHIGLRQFRGWMESSYALLSCGHGQQKAFEQEVKKMLKAIRANRGGVTRSNAVGFIVGHPRHAMALICVGVAQGTKKIDMRNAVQVAYEQTQQQHSTATSLVIVRSLATDEYPYTASYLLKSDEEPASVMIT